jgi:beta-lactamase regulating signal transducer with metallopeptidase domain
MNSFIESLNQWGNRFSDFAWPMFWQSSLLIVFLFAIEFLIRRKIRASVRYALWLVVLVKLCLPPTLASPSSPVWWLHQTPPPAFPKLHYSVSYDTRPMPDISLNPPPAYVPPKPAITAAAWVSLASGIVSAGLFAWLLVRWWQITRQVHRAKNSERLTAILNKTRRLADIKSLVPVKVTWNSMSPAVCGLFRPVILIPQLLAEGFSDDQLRVVLLHEMVHLRRRDVWLNCLQALVQIVYWWHPLVWLANARIRRVREEAVDDAVMLALRDEGDSYAPTLLEVAKFALNRPFAGLGLVGILESRSALRQRIERLVNFRAPRRAGLTFVSCCCIFAFSAVALPMGEAPGPVEKSISTDLAEVQQQSLTLKVNPEIFIRNVEAQASNSLLSPTNDYTVVLLDLLRTEGVDCAPPNGIAFNHRTGEITTQNTTDKLEIFRQVIEQLNRTDGPCALPLSDNPLRKRVVIIDARIYQMPSANFDDFVSGLQFYHGRPGSDDWWSASPEQFARLVGKLEASGLQLIQRPRIQTPSGITAEMFIGSKTNSGEFDCKPYVADGFVNLALQGTFVGVDSAGAGFTNYFSTKASAKDRGGIVVRVNNYGGDAGNNLVAAIGVEIVTNPAPFRERLRVTIHDDGKSGSDLLSDGKTLYDMGRFDEAEACLREVLARDPKNQVAHYYMNLVQVSKAAGPGSQRIRTQSRRKQIVEMLNRIRIDQFGPKNQWPLKEVVRELNQLSAGYDSNKIGIRFSTADYADGRQPRIDPNTGLLSEGAGSKDVNIDSVTVSFTSALTDVTLANVLDVIVMTANEPIEYAISDDGVVFAFRNGREALRLYSRSFKVDAHVFPNALRNITGLETNDVAVTARNLFDKSGVEFKPPKSVFYNDRLGLLFVRATLPELDKVERILETLNCLQPQIHIKARFIELPGSAVGDVYLGSINPGSLIEIGDGHYVSRDLPGSFTGIMTESQFRTTLHGIHAISHNPGFEELAEPEVTTTSGRQTEMRATQTIQIFTNFVFTDGLGYRSNSITPLGEHVETGPLLDVVPYALPDGYTIDLKTIASVTEFLGYRWPTNAYSVTNQYIVVNAAGQRIDLPTISPSFAIRKASANIRLWDGQTVVLGGMKMRFYDGGKEDSAIPGFFKDRPNQQDKELLVFVTVTLVDSAGNRIHSDDEVSFAKNSIPPQTNP